MRLLTEILAGYARVTLALRRAPLPAVLAAVREAPPPGVRAPEMALGEAGRLGRAVARGLRIAPGDTRCLVRSLVLTRLLARRGLDTRVVIGARASPRFLAHAWVEYHGVPVLDPGDGSFERLTEL